MRSSSSWLLLFVLVVCQTNVFVAGFTTIGVLRHANRPLLKKWAITQHKQPFLSSTASSTESTSSIDTDADSEATSFTSTTTSSSLSTQSEHDDRESPSETTSWAKYALLISSFTDGILHNAKATSFLKYALATLLLEEKVKQAERAVETSVMASPCNGPSMEAFGNLEKYDNLLREKNNDSTNGLDEYSEESACRLLQDYAQSISMEDATPTQLRLLYIPTAMYALNPLSNNTPGKQRQRARADGKKRRTQVVNYVQSVLEPQLNNVQVLTITLDLDDGSLKQPAGSDHANDFPKDEVEALTTWEPHLVYVEGGNTFWLQHCLDKNEAWAKALRQACCGETASALYIGKSAGAIVAGAHMETATWKGWDDPQVVSDKPTYGDWIGHPGLGMVGQQSFFPHMSHDWTALVEEKRQSMASHVVCLEEEDACCVDGMAQKSFVVSGDSAEDSGN